MAMCTQGRGIRPSNSVYFPDKLRRILLHTWEMGLDHDLTNQLDCGRYVINPIRWVVFQNSNLTRGTTYDIDTR